MNWIEIIQKAMSFIEMELANSELSSQLVAKHVHVSESHFTRAFQILTGFTLSEYIRNRRLCVAGEQLQGLEISVSEVALNVGYESAEAFSKAFKRFHGVTPSESRGEKLKVFYPLQVKLILTQERPLTYTIQEKTHIFLNGITNSVPSDDPNATGYLWAKSETDGYLDRCCGFSQFETLVGVSTGEGYTIKAKCTQPSKDTVVTIPPHKWAIFPCPGEMPHSILQIWKQIYTSWIPRAEYEIVDQPQLEVYFEVDEGYACEIWIPVK